MYHIKHDKRAQASVELLCGALMALLEQKSFSEITVTDLQQKSSVSRSTFYRNFDSTEDVLALLCDEGFQAVLLRMEETGETLPTAVFRYWFEHSTVLETIVSIHRLDLLYESLHRFLTGLRPADDYLSAIIASGMAGILATWIKHGRIETEEQVLLRVADAFVALAGTGIFGSDR